MDTLYMLGEDMGFDVVLVPLMRINDEVVSSTTIRNALADGDMQKVKSLAGRYFSVQGQVIPGVHRGAQLGFPTANLAIDPEQGLPVNGVYATWASINNNTYQSMTNIGTRPTFDNNQRTVEVHVLDYQGDLYGQELEIEFIERLRDEKKFNNVEALKKQIADDIQQGMVILESGGGK